MRSLTTTLLAAAVILNVGPTAYAQNNRNENNRNQNNRNENNRNGNNRNENNRNGNNRTQNNRNQNNQRQSDSERGQQRRTVVGTVISVENNGRTFRINPTGEARNEMVIRTRERVQFQGRNGRGDVNDLRAGDRVRVQVERQNGEWMADSISVMQNNGGNNGGNNGRNDRGYDYDRNNRDYRYDRNDDRRDYGYGDRGRNDNRGSGHGQKTLLGTVSNIQPDNRGFGFDPDGETGVLHVSVDGRTEFDGRDLNRYSDLRIGQRLEIDAFRQDTHWLAERINIIGMAPQDWIRWRKERNERNERLGRDGSDYDDRYRSDDRYRYDDNYRTDDRYRYNPLPRSPGGRYDNDNRGTNEVRNVEGRVTSVERNGFRMTLERGGEMFLETRPGTTYTRGLGRVDRGDLNRGDRIRVRAVRQPGGRDWIATTVQFTN